MRSLRRRVVDSAGLLPTDVAVRWLRRVRRHRIDLLPNTRRLFERRGLYPIRDHYYEPLINRTRLQRDHSTEREIAGVDWREAAQWSLLERTCGARPVQQELAALARFSTDALDHEYYLHNGYFGPGDADVLYGLIRALKPSRLVEIGSGHSTRLAARALAQNTRESGVERQHVCIEPYRHQAWFAELHVTHVAVPVEEVGHEALAEWVDTMQANDILFIDSSHVIRPQGDVLFNVLQLLPRLASGVYIHVHDIFSPADYPDEWLVDRMHFWNEQYLLEAFLMYNSHFEVCAALPFLFKQDPQRLERLLPTLNERRSDIGFTSMWLRKR